MMQKLIPIAIILAAVALFYLYTNPTYTGPVKEADALLMSYNKALDAAGKFKEKEAKLANERNEIRPENVRRVETFLPDSVNNVQLLLDMSTLASNSGVQLSNFDVKSNAADPNVTLGDLAGAPSGSSPLSLESTSPVDSLDLSVNATGTYGAFRTFLRAAEQSLRPLDVTSITVKSSDKGVYTYAITFRIYWLH